jgi:uncharacterized damage-inducible protein DinB
MSLADALKDAIGSILDRELRALRREVEAYSDEADLWRTPPGISNPAGTLVLHLAGNLQHFLGACLGQTGYVRDRAAEFSRRSVARAELLREIEAARHAITEGLAHLDSARLTAEYPETVAEARITTAEYLMHLASHCAYHLGQIDYHRRLVTGSDTTIGAMRPVELSSARPAGR